MRHVSVGMCVEAQIKRESVDSLELIEYLQASNTVLKPTKFGF